MLALVDGDIIVYRIGYTTEQNDWYIARWRCDEMMEGILKDVEADEYRVYLSDSTHNGFRSKVLPSYKANRTQPKPKHYEDLKAHLIGHWDARIALGEEADDRLGIEQDYDPEIPPEVWQTVICSIDKDLHQVPGHHWNFVKKEWQTIFQSGATRFFWKQVLTGDVVDNIKGIYGIGPKRAEKILSSVPDGGDYFARILDEYRRAYQEQAERNLLITGRVIKIRTREGELWNFPMEYTQLQPSLDYPSSSTPSEQEGDTPSTEPTTTAPIG